MKSLLFILPEFYPHPGGGIATFYLQLLPQLKPHFERIKVIVGSGYTCSNDVYDFEGIEVEYLKPEMMKKHLAGFSKFDVFPRLKRDLAAAWAMFEQARNGDGFDVVECTDFGLGYIPWLVTREKPVLIRMHGSSGQINHYDPNPSENLNGDFNKLLEATFFQKAFLATYSESNKLFWQKVLPGKEIHKILPVYSDFSSEGVPFEQRKRNGLVTGRLQYWKGPIVTCEALIKAESDCKVEWYGRDMIYQSNERTMGSFLAEKYPGIWNNRFQFKGKVAKQEVARLQKEALFGLVPSQWDMFNFTCIEFMAAQTPMVCSRQTGATELVIPGMNGFLFDSNDPEELAETLDNIFSLNRQAYNELAINSRLTLENKLSPEVLLPSYLEMYRKCLNSSYEAIDPFLTDTVLPNETTYQLDFILDSFTLKDVLKYSFNRTQKKLFK